MNLIISLYSRAYTENTVNIEEEMEALLKCDSLSPAGNALDTEAIERTVLEIASSQRYSALLTTAKNARLGLTFSLFESDSPMSNFYNCNTVIDGFVWPCLEHYFQHEKAGG